MNLRASALLYNSALFSAIRVYEEADTCSLSFSSSRLSSFYSITMFLAPVHMLRLLQSVVEREREISEYDVAVVQLLEL